ncbi:MAG: nuclear transport factor 2 family protein [Acidimicrobiales bacterium]
MGDAEDRLAALEAKVQRLCDIEDIRLLRMRFHDAINQGRAGEVAALFAEGAGIDYGYLGTTTNVGAFFGKLPDLLQFIKQFIHNHVIELDGDSGHGFAYLEAKTISNGTAFRVAGRYDDRYVRTPNGWRFAHMQFTPYFTVPFAQDWTGDDLLQMGRSS